MTVYPLAVYTADHGMEWTYPKGKISLSELDRCRKVFGRLPEFDYGERGFEGVFIDAERVFAVRCQSAPGRDFRGRRAIYIAVTWVSRGAEAARTDFEELLAAPAMSEPQASIPPSFSVFAVAGDAEPFLDLPLSLPDGFRRAGRLAADIGAGCRLVLKRAAGETAVSVRSLRTEPPPPTAAAHPGPEREEAPAPEARFIPAPVFLSAALLLLLAVLALAFHTRREIRRLEEEIKAVGSDVRMLDYGQRVLFDRMHRFPAAAPEDSTRTNAAESAGEGLDLAAGGTRGDSPGGNGGEGRPE